LIDSRLEAVDDSLLKKMQCTLRSEIELAGVGIFTGAATVVRIIPALPDTGIVFHREDLPDTPPIPAHFDFAQESLRCTTLSRGGASIMLVEHLLSALYACGVDNAKIFVRGPEIPGLDGSSRCFVEALDKVGLVYQDEERKEIALDKPVFWSRGEIHLIAIPSSEFRLSYTMHYPQSPFLKSQYYSFPLNPDRYRSEIAPCRTFSLYEEILPLLEKGLIRGGGLENAVVIRGTEVLNPEGIRFPDEMVRHKILDLIGDLSLVGFRFRAHVIAICSGHEANVAFAEKISEILQPRSLCGS